MMKQKYYQSPAEIASFSPRPSLADSRAVLNQAVADLSVAREFDSLNDTKVL